MLPLPSSEGGGWETGTRGEGGEGITGGTGTESRENRGLRKRVPFRVYDNAHRHWNGGIPHTVHCRHVEQTSNVPILSQPSSLLLPTVPQTLQRELTSLEDKLSTATSRYSSSTERCSALAEELERGRRELLTTRESVRSHETEKSRLK